MPETGPFMYSFQKKLSKTANELNIQKERTVAAVRAQKEVTNQNKALVRENSELKAAARTHKEVATQNKALVRQVSELKTQKTELERANRALKRGENAAQIAKRIRTQDTVYCRGNVSNTLVFEGSRPGVSRKGPHFFLNSDNALLSEFGMGKSSDYLKIDCNRHPS